MLNLARDGLQTYTKVYRSWSRRSKAEFRGVILSTLGKMDGIGGFDHLLYNGGPRKTSHK